MNMLRVDEFQQSGVTMSTTEPALLDSAPWRLRYAVRVKNFIDHDRTRMDAGRKSLTSRNIVRPDAGRQTKVAVIRETHGFVFGTKAHDRQNWSKCLFLHHVHLLID